MNKGITILILLVVLGAMGLVMYSHIGGREEIPVVAGDPSEPRMPVSQGGRASPLQAPQGDANRLPSFEPPLSSSPSLTFSPRAEGAPRPVNITGSGGQSARPPQSRPAATPQASASAGNAGANPKAAQASPSSENARSGVSAPDAAPSSSSGTSAPAPQKTTQAPTASRSPRTPAETPASASGSSVQSSLPSSDQKPPQDNRPPARTDNRNTDPPAAQSAATARQAVAGSPGLTPWKTPPQGAPAGSSRATASVQPAGQNASPTPESQSEKGRHSLQSIRLVPSGQNVQLRIEADSAFSCNTFVLTGPDRLVVDLPGSWKGMKAPATPQNSLVKNVRLGQQPSGPRLVLDLTGPAKGHKVERSGNTIQIVVQ